MRALAEFLGETKKTSASDEAIRGSILTEMRRQTWCPLHALRVVVRKGVVELRGTIFDERQRRALRVLVEAVEGVKGIHDHLMWTEAMSGAVTDVPKVTVVAKQSGRPSHRSSLA